MTAQEMFSKNGFSITRMFGDTLLYMNNDIAFKMSIHFDKSLKNYNTSCEIWIENDDNWRKEVYENEGIINKFSAKYGYWQNVIHSIDVELHKAIHQQMKELGWLDE